MIGIAGIENHKSLEVGIALRVLYMKDKLFLVPEPSGLDFSGKWIKFDGFSNLPPPIENMFGLKKGTWDIKKIKRNGQGVSVSKDKIEVWGDINVAYATLIQIAKNKHGYLPEITLEEEDNFKFRGFHLDIARGGVPNLKTFQTILKWMFLLKYNKFAIYFEDLFPWTGKPEIGKNRGRLTNEEWKQILKTGSELSIDVFPSLELLGHMEHILKIPKYQEFSELWWMGYDCLDISNKRAKKFAISLLEDALDKTTSDLIHIGGDETWILGRGRSLDTLHEYKGPELYLEHYREMVKTVTDRNKTPMLWGDMLTGMYLTEDGKKLWKKVVDDTIWDKAIIANWDYEPLDTKHFIDRIHEIGHKKMQIVSPSLNNWSTFYPDFDSAIKNIVSFIEAAKIENLLGYMVTAWGDGGQESLFTYLYPLLLASVDYSTNRDLWPVKYSVLTGENIETSRLRFAAGVPSVGPALRNVLYSPLNYIEHRRELPRDWTDKMNDFYKSSEGVNLPEEMQIIKNMVSNAINFASNTFDKSSYMKVVDQYEKLWLDERKPDGLENIVSRFMGTYEAKRLGFR
jgi:hexosaminidase